MKQQTLMNTVGNKSKELIYHYTTLDSLIGMMNNTSDENPFLTFWATHTDFMNDPEENRYGARIMMSVMRDIEKELKIPKEQRISELNENDLYSFHLSDKADFQSLTSEYSISFSKENDFLPMWSMYAKKGQGICLGFDQKQLDNYLIKNECKRSCEMVYGKPNGEKWIEKLRNSYEENRNNLIEGVRDGKMQKNYIPLYNYILLYRELSKGIKHEAYKYEREVRIYYEEKKHEVKFRTGGESIIPYIEISLPLEALVEIKLGPSYHSAESFLPIIKFFKNKMHDKSNLILKKIKFTVSDIPYRIDK